MLKDATLKDKEEIAELHRVSFHKKREELDYFFSDVYSTGKNIVSEQDNRIVASLFVKEHTMHFLNRYLMVSQISSIATLPDYRRRGHMDKLMHSCLDEMSKKHFITLIQAFNPKLYERYGFETVYYRKVYEIQRSYIENVSILNVKEEVSAKHCKEVYDEYCKCFDGYYERDLEYFEQMIHKAKKQNDMLCACYSPEGKIQGYAYVKNMGRDRKITEIIYLDSATLKKLIKYSIGFEHSVQVEVTNAEKLEKLFTLAIPKKISYMMARINNYALFNKLFDCKVKNSEEAYQLLRKHQFLHEEY